MNKYLNIILLFSILISGCPRHNKVNLPSLTEEKNKNKIDKINKINTVDTKSLKLTLSSYEKQLKKKIGFDEFTILKIFKNPSLNIKHGKTKNLQFHLQFCHLDLFFLKKEEGYFFKYFAIRPSSISSSLNRTKCVKELNHNFILLHGPK